MTWQAKQSDIFKAHAILRHHMKATGGAGNVLAVLDGMAARKAAYRASIERWAERKFARKAGGGL